MAHVHKLMDARNPCAFSRAMAGQAAHRRQGCLQVRKEHRMPHPTHHTYDVVIHGGAIFGSYWSHVLTQIGRF